MKIEVSALGEPVAGRTTISVAGQAAPAPMNLIVTSENGKDRCFALTKAVTTIGRSTERDISIVDRKVSSHHAEIRRNSAGLYTIHDCQSTNGTFLNGQPIHESVLKLNDELTIGSTLIVFTNRSVFEKTAKIILSPDALRQPGSSSGAFVAPTPPPQDATRGMLEIPLGDIEKRFFQGLDEQGASLDVAQKLKLIARLSNELNSVLELDQLLEKVMDIILEVIQCDRAFIILTAHGKLVPKVIRKKAGVKDQKGLSISATILNQVLRDGKALLTSDAQDDDRFHGGDSIMFYSIRSALTVPLKAKEAVLGVIHLDKVTATKSFKEEDLQVLALICNQAASNVANAQLVEELRRTNAELRQAKEEVLRWNLELEQKVEERTREVVKKNEEVMRLNAQKDELMGMVAHDLRTPITAILGFTDVMSQHLELGAEPARLQEDVEIVGRISREMSDLLNDLLDVAKIEAGKITIQRERRPIRELVLDCYHTYSYLVEPKHLKLELDLDTNLPSVPYDVRRIGQVLNNLLANAVKFSRSGDRITIATRHIPGAIEVSVTDTGQGIPAHELPKIFGRFEQTSTRATRGEVGTGLGLAIAKKLVELHGGCIRCESKQGVGSKFAFTLPTAE
jgi:signal transduction histidine kinase